MTTEVANTIGKPEGQAEIIGNVRRLGPTPSMTVETLVHSEHESSMGMGSISSQRRELKDDVPVKPRREELNHLMPNRIIINTLEDVLGPWSGGKQLQEVDNTGTIFRQTWVDWGSGSRW